MPSFFPRHLLFPSPPSSSSPMWDRPQTNAPIFASTRASRPDSMMWSRPGVGLPIYEEPCPTPAKTQMWRRSGMAVAPVCPCCTGEINRSNNDHNHNAEERPASMETIASEDEPATPSPRHSNQSTRRRPSVSSGLSLRLKKSFASLRSRASRSTMRE